MSNLKSIRIKRGLSQGQLAIKSHVELRTIQAYEQGYRDINKASYSILNTLAKSLNCEIKDIIEK